MEGMLVHEFIVFSRVGDSNTADFAWAIIDNGANC